MSSIPSSVLPVLPGLDTDKLVHGVVCAVLGALTGRTLWSSRPISSARATIVAAVCAALYGISDELHQMSTQER